MPQCTQCGENLWYDAGGGPGTVVRPYCRTCDGKPQAKIQVPAGTLPDGFAEKFGYHVEEDCPAPPYDPNVIVTDSTSIQSHSLNIEAESLNMRGTPVLQCYDELPTDAEQGTIAYKTGDPAAHVFDGHEWQNLGKVARSMSDKKIDRRGAIAATRAKAKAKAKED